MFGAFPKILQLSDPKLADLFEGPVQITEKVDGSQFAFGKLNGELRMRSKGRELVIDAPDKMFAEAVEYVKHVQDRLLNNYVYYAEYLKKPKHNTISYSRTPENHLALFGMKSPEGKLICRYSVMLSEAEFLNIDVVPLIFDGVANFDKTGIIDWMNELLDTDSFLGNSKIEGVVIKNFGHEVFLAGHILPIMSAKWVSEKFKEKNHAQRKHNKTGKLEAFIEQFRTEARWEKAVQHLQDNGELERCPRDIGMLIKEIHADIEVEEIDYIREWLVKYYLPQIYRKSTAGFPEWYKERLLKEAVNAEEV